MSSSSTTATAAAAASRIKAILPSASYRPSAWQSVATTAIRKALAARSDAVDVLDEHDYDNRLGYELPAVVKPDGAVLFEPRAAAAFLLGVSAEHLFSQSEELARAIAQVKSSGNICPVRYTTSNPVDQLFLAAINELAGHAEYAVDREWVFHYDFTEKRIPIEGRRNILITAALPYVNNVPHLGNIIGAVLSGDVFARYSRLRGHQVLYICGTDEYGTATETKALEEQTTCQEVCDRYYQLHAAIYEWFQIRFDHFGRTSTPAQTAITHDIFAELYTAGYFIEQSVEQSWCERCSRFLADRYVEGTCPLCAFPDARGDQCDGCGKLMNPTELRNARCKVCRSTPSIRSSTHLFLDLTRLQPECQAFVERASVAGSWSSNSAAIARAWLTEGLKPRCMTRDLRWGTPVPLEHMRDKVFYVWFDAPIGYLSITAGYFNEDGPGTAKKTADKRTAMKNWELWWKNPDQVQLYQFMGKDNVPFHTVIFPSTLLGCHNTRYTLLHHINTTEYLTYESGKFSKSRKLGVFGNDARDSGIAPSLWRYYLLASRPESTDAAFMWEDFASKCNSELLANLGNLVNRVARFTVSKFNGRLAVPDDLPFEDADQALITAVNKELSTYIENMDAVKLKAGLKNVMNISSLANGHLSTCRLDSKLAIEHPQRCQQLLLLVMDLVYLISTLIEPFLPSTSTDILQILRLPPRRLADTWTGRVIRRSGYTVGQPKLLFSRIEEWQVQELRARFGGAQVLSSSSGGK